ncbi:MAG: LCP family protein [Coriobacteriia bacterium]
MAKKSNHRPPKSRRHPVLVAAGAIAVIVAAAALLAQAGVLGSRGVPADALSRVLIVAASPDENGSVVGQIVMIADVTAQPAALEPVSPALAVSIPGTTYDTLADAYPFGGGAGTAEALARARDEEPLPYVAISASELTDAVDAAGGMRVTLPEAMSVFDGTDLFTFKAGTQTLTAARLSAVLKGAPYLADREREALDASLAEGLAVVLSAEPGVLTGATRTDLAPDALERLAAAM